MSRTICIAVGLLVFCASVRAQEPPAPKPGPEHALLKKMEGTWDALMKMPPDAPKAMAGVATYKLECDGMWLSSDFRMDDPAFKFQGKGLDGYDQVKKKYVGIWVDSMSTAPMVSEGTYDAATKTSTMTGIGPGMDGKPQKYKMTTKHIDDDHQRFEMFMVGADGKESLSFTIDYTRRK